MNKASEMINKVEESYGFKPLNTFADLLSDYKPWDNCRILFAIMYSGEFDSAEVRQAYYESFKSSFIDPWDKFKMFYLDLVYRFNITDKDFNYKDKEILDKLPGFLSFTRDNDNTFTLNFKYYVEDVVYNIKYIYDKKLVIIMQGNTGEHGEDPYSWSITSYYKYHETNRREDSNVRESLFDFVTGTILSNLCEKYMKFIYENYKESGFDCCMQHV